MKQQSLREQAYKAIREWLHTQVLAKGSVTSEIQLSQRLDMSRTPVRAALQQLELEGYLRTIPKHGILILESSAQRVGDLLDLIFALVLFSYEQNRHSHFSLAQAIESEMFEISQLIAAIDHHTRPEQCALLELNLFRILTTQCRNLEMNRLFEQSVERLAWHSNIGRWRAPYLSETSVLLTELLYTLKNVSLDFPAKLFSYLQLLKKTWV